MRVDWQIILLYGLGGLALLLVLWPTVNGGRRFLKRWGVKDPTEQQGELARTYLLHRRLLYPLLFLLAPVVTVGDDFFAPLVTALLLAEVIGMLRPVKGPRVAALARRSWSDLVQRWAVITMLGLAVVSLLLASGAGIAQNWGQRVVNGYPPDGSWRTDRDIVTNVADVQSKLAGSPWLSVILGVITAAVAVLGIVWLAVRRGAIADLPTDAALRTRSARVAVGIGIAFMALSVGQANNALSNLRDIRWPEPAPALLANTGGLAVLGLPLLFVAIVGWFWVANPASRMPYVQSAQA